MQTHIGLEPSYAGEGGAGALLARGAVAEVRHDRPRARREAQLDRAAEAGPRLPCLPALCRLRCRWLRHRFFTTDPGVACVAG